ncbi:Uma2 family endonuclease [cf. Phormidesmis sp. LEGE 11477]|uniref:Uma2 family endonuclease n=1 Tax=cf. Phormidesmis sp. LEGE 11477 TaxID=1828680 RepID=UPI0018824A8B|nr:Uma2 family endonuclease [cf. Phormidesmis sp. LEGE 11477]MBE9062764.1 Uma2 family endonuclease [cf. Phormidesmis sp. LEGE 11477]
MDTAKLTRDTAIYPDTDGQPMSESDATRDYLIYAVEVLRLYFQSRRQVYVSGNLFIYYEQGNPKAVVSPDVFVVFGVSARQRKSYKTWQEGNKLPSFVLEITSESTQKKDEVEKPQLYASLGVQEYFQYDPTADYLKPQLKGRTLVNGQYQPLSRQETAEGISYLSSKVLGLDLQLRPEQALIGIVPLPKSLRFYDPQTGLYLLNRREVEQQWTLSQQERDTAQQERDEAQQERDEAQQKAQQLADRLRALGVDPDEAV